MKHALRAARERNQLLAICRERTTFAQDTTATVDCGAQPAALTL